MKLRPVLSFALFMGICFTSSFSQGTIKDYSFPTPGIDESHHQVKVYYPPGYQSNDTKKYNE